MGGPKAVVTTLRFVVGGVAIIVATTAVALALARPELGLEPTIVRAVADVAAAVCLGLTLVARLDEDRYRDELTRRASVPLAVAASVWLIAELSRIVVSAAQAAATPVAHLSVRTVLEFAWSTSTGRSGLFSLAAAAVVCVLAVAVPPAVTTWVGMTGIVTVGVAARAVTGHLSESMLGAAAVVVHAVAAAVWCGTLAALALTVTARGQWARVLPRFSQLALGCVVVLVGGGIIAALGPIGSPAALVTTAYGRILTAKIAITAGLLILAWRNRTGWLTSARAHRLTAEASLVRAVFELALMACALSLAAALTLTG